MHKLWVSMDVIVCNGARLNAQTMGCENVRTMEFCPLLIVGDRDRDTTLPESYAMFRVATGPKELWN